jgi:ABC-2 type transport system ATP-binding protein
MTVPSLRVTGLQKQFGRVAALAGVDLEVGIGVNGLLGPNGAGKTTLLRCLATVLAPDRGELRILGRDPSRRSERTEIRRRLGYLPQELGSYPHFTAFDFLDYVAILKELVDRRERHAEVRRVMDAVGLADWSQTRIRKLSGGMRRRLALAQALLGDPMMVLLDEPTVGLDPEQRLRFRQLASDLAEERIVLLSTHQTEDVAALCDRVTVLDRGRVLFDGSPQGLAEQARGRVWLADVRPERARVSWRNAAGRIRSVGDPPSGAELTDPTVEDGYLLLVGRQVQDEAA